MSQECTHINPLQRDGTSQRQRMLAALDPSFIQVDEREIHDWLLYARKYAELLRYYNVHNVPDGNWVLFIEKDISTLVAMVSDTDVSEFRIRFEAWVAQAETVIESRDATVSAEAFAGMLVVLYEMADKLSYWFANAIEGLGLHTQLKTLIASRLEDSFAQLIRWLEGALECEIPLAGAGLEDLDLARLQRTWPGGDLPVSLVPFYKGIPDREKEINRELIYLERLFKRFYEVMAHIVKQAPQFLEETFTDYPQHQPHIALFLAFLNLMEIARDHMNTLTQRHLDFYYKEVLQLTNGPEDPDEVHIILELANNFDQHLLALNTDFDAGQDDAEEDLIYATDEEIVVNRIALDEDHGLKTLFLHKAEDEADPNAPIINIHASLDADALSPEGAENTEPYAQWETLGNEHMPYGEVGFALASPMFLMGEGERTATITFRLNQFQSTLNRYSRSRIKSELKNNVKVYLSGEEGWFLVENREVDIQTAGLPNITPSDDLDQLGDLKWVLKLTPEDPPIIPYNEEIHQRGFDTIFPTALFILDNEGLQTLGNLDLTLAGGIAGYEDGNFYLGGELVFASGTHTVFQAQADVIGLDPSSTDPLWEKTDLEISSIPLYVPGDPYEIGDIVKDEDGNIFIANACIEDGPAPMPFPDPPPQPTPKSTGKHVKGHLPPAPEPKPQGPMGDIPMVWELASPDLFEYRPEIDYSELSLVIFEGNVYQATKDIEAITPNQSRNWGSVKGYINTQTYQKGFVVAGGAIGEYHEVVAQEIKGIAPTADKLIWERIKEHDDEVEYEIKSIIFFTNTVATESESKVYQTNSKVGGILPTDSLLNIWGPPPEYVSNKEYTAGEEVHNNGKIYLLEEGTLTGVEPSEGEILWNKIDTSLYISSETYTPNDYVEIENAGIELYQYVGGVDSSVQGIAPDSTNNAWAPISAHIDGDTYSKGRVVFVEDDGGFKEFFLATEETNSSPKNDDSTTVADTEVDDTTETSENTGGTIGDSDSDNTLEGTVPDLWKKLMDPVEYEGDETYFFTVEDEDILTVNIVAINDGANPIKYFQVSPQLDNATNDLISVSVHKINPETTIPLWSPQTFKIYSPGDSYTAIEIVKEGNDFYEAIKNVKGVSPSRGSSPWIEVEVKLFDYNQWYSRNDDEPTYTKEGGTVFKIGTTRVLGIIPSNTTNPWTEKVSPSWEENFLYPDDQIIERNNVFFLASSPSQGVDPSSGQTHWKGISVADLEQFNITQTYAYQNNPPFYVNYLGTAYELTNIQGITTNDTAPNRNSDCWKIVSSLDEYASTVEYKPKPVQYVTFQGRIFLTRFKVIGTPPGFNIPVWGPVTIEDIDEYDPGQYYLQGDFVEVMVNGVPCYFQANGGIQGIAPTLEDSIEYWEEVPYYSYTPGYFYNAGSCIVLAGRLYRVIGPDPTDQKPGIAASTDWEELTEIDAFQEGNSYTPGNIVNWNGKFYKNIQATAEVAPGSTARPWQELLTIAQYNLLDSYVAGEYVMFQGEYYRPLTEVGGQDPLTAPDLWEKVGVIKPYDEDRAYFIGQHVSLEGKVYRAIQNLPPRHGNLIQGNWEAYWTLVPGSYPYNYFIKPELEEIDLEVEVKGMQNVLLENDDGTIEPGKPFNPFGALPKIGSKFYVGSQEVFQKSLSGGDLLNVEWARSA